MKDITRIQLNTVILLSLIIIGIVLLGYQKISLENTYFQNELSSFLVPVITLGEKRYAVENGKVSHNDEAVSLLLSNKVLRVAWYSVANRLDPIFALEGTNPERLQSGVEFLAASLDSFATLYAPDEKLIRESFHPLNFLKNLGQLEALRLSRITIPSSQLVKNYNRKLTLTIELYNKDLHSLKRTWNELSTRENLSKTFNFLGGYSDIQIFIHALDTLEKSSSKKRSELERRWNCYQGNIRSCFPLANALDKNVILNDRTEINTRKPAISEDIEINKNIIIHYLLSDIHDEHQISLRTPLVALNKSACLSHVSPVYYLGWWTPIDEKNKQFQLALINDLYFYDSSRGIQESFLYTINKKGLSLLYQNVVNLYMCPDSAQDISRVMTVYTIRDLLAGNPLFLNDSSVENSILRDRLLSLANLEKKIITGTVVYESDVSQYLHTLLLLLKDRGEAQLAQEIGKENIYFIEKLLSIFYQRSSKLDGVIVNAASENLWVKRLKRITQQEMSLDHLFLSRGYPATLFLAFNKSFTDENISFMKNEFKEPDLFNLVSYNDFLKHLFTIEEILEKMEFARKIWIKGI